MTIKYNIKMVEYEDDDEDDEEEFSNQGSEEESEDDEEGDETEEEEEEDDENMINLDDVHVVEEEKEEYDPISYPLDSVRKKFQTAKKREFVPEERRILPNVLSIFEKARILGFRASQLQNGALPNFKTKLTLKPQEMAMAELKNGCFPPFVIVRLRGGNVYEKWHVHELLF